MSQQDGQQSQVLSLSPTSLARVVLSNNRWIGTLNVTDSVWCSTAASLLVASWSAVQVVVVVLHE